MSKLTRASLIVAFFFGVDKILALLRQVIIARSFGLSPELDAFNVANNVPDLLFALISGGALSVAFIPIMATVLTRDGKPPAWLLFSRIANITFTLTAVLALLVALLADKLVGWELGIAPGFGPAQQALVVLLMRMNLLATLVFSISGLVMAGLHANQHFLLPAMAPPLYNLGQIFGALILAPSKGMSIGGVTLPAFGLGIQGLVYGVIIGALLHLAIQIPGLLKFKFHWSPGFGWRDAEVKKVLGLMGPRLITMLFIQLIFLVRDNLASRMAAGSVTALTYGWMLQQLPETLIGTALGIALLPTLSEQFARDDREGFLATMNKALKVLIALTLPVAVVMSIGLRPLIPAVFGFDAAGTDLLMWATRGYLLGLTGQSLLEIATRSFYARQSAWFPLLGAVVNVTIYIGLGALLFRPLGAPGISLTDSVAFTVQAVLLLAIFARRFAARFELRGSLLRGVIAALLAGLVSFAVLQLGAGRMNNLLVGLASLALGVVVAVPVIWKELRLLVRL